MFDVSFITFLNVNLKAKIVWYPTDSKFFLYLFFEAQNFEVFLKLPVKNTSKFESSSELLR